MFRIEGGDNLGRKLDSVAKRVAKQIEAALYQEAEAVRTDSMRNTPVDTGALRASHRVERPVVRDGGVEVEIVVGGPAADYAVYVHEDLDAFHRVGEAKFLEKAVNRARPGLSGRIGGRIDFGGV